MKNAFIMIVVWASILRAETLRSELSSQLLEIGYCLLPSDSVAAYRDSGKFSDNLVMYIWAHVDSAAPDSGAECIVSLIPVKDALPSMLEKSLLRPLVTITLDMSVLENQKIILAKKIVENLRMQYICCLSINSEPPGITLRTESGLEGITPLKWVLPVATMKIEGRERGYVPLIKEISLAHPGDHTYFLQLKKRQFYHSNFLYPSVLCAVAVVGCYAADKYYFDRYMSLGEDDFYSHPDRFEREFAAARFFERCTTVSFGLSAVFLGLSFRF
jgi:hypothetical protein